MPDYSSGRPVFTSSSLKSPHRLQLGFGAPAADARDEAEIITPAGLAAAHEQRHARLRATSMPRARQHLISAALHVPTSFIQSRACLGYNMPFRDARRHFRRSSDDSYTTLSAGTSPDIEEMPAHSAAPPAFLYALSAYFAHCRYVSCRRASGLSPIYGSHVAGSECHAPPRGIITDDIGLSTPARMPKTRPDARYFLDDDGREYRASAIFGRA